MALLHLQGQIWTQNKVLFVALILRWTLVLYSHIHDYIFKVSFTDVDYHVFTDSAFLIWEGKSPFDRPTYRYTPVLAWILIPNIWWSDFGKFLFCLCDIVVGWILINIAQTRVPETPTRSHSNSFDVETILPVVVFWLANPLTAVISSRGNADVLVCIAVLAVLKLLIQDKSNWYYASLLHGMLAIHLKVYPLIYLPSIFVYLSNISEKSTFTGKLWALILNVRGYAFVLTSLMSFFTVLGVLYMIYGNIFLEEFLLYHIKRTDTRHNFSAYFLPMYLFKDSYDLKFLFGIFAFIPQISTMSLFGIKYHNDLPFCWFVTTFSFVTFNKVCTSQYFVWYIVFTPLIVSQIKFSFSRVLILVVVWFSSQGLWLLFAFLLEFHAYSVFMYIWLSSLAFLLVNSCILGAILRNYDLNNIFKEKHD